MQKTTSHSNMHINCHACQCFRWFLGKNGLIEWLSAQASVIIQVQNSTAAERATQSEPAVLVLPAACRCSC